MVKRLMVVFGLGYLNISKLPILAFYAGSFPPVADPAFGGMPQDTNSGYA